MLAAVTLCAALENEQRKVYACVWKQIREHAKFSFQEKRKRTLSQLGKREGKMIKCLYWVIKTGRINIIQRGFWRWKFHIFSIAKNPVLLFSNKDRLASIRSFSTFLKTSTKKLIRTCFYTWYSLKPKNKLELIQKTKNLCLNNCQNYFIRSLQIIFSLWRGLKPMHKSSKKFFCLKFLNKIYLKVFGSYFLAWKDPGFYIEQYVYEKVSERHVETKRFKVGNKPSIPIEYYDYQWYDPAFRAVFRCLGHFIKRKMKLYYKLWKENIDRSQYQIEALTGFLSESLVDYGAFKLSFENLRKLKMLLIHFNRIQDSIREMPNNCLNLWCEKAHIKALKEIRFKIVTVHHQRQKKKTRMFFSNLRHKIMYCNNFTDEV